MAQPVIQLNIALTDLWSVVRRFNGDVPEAIVLAVPARRVGKKQRAKGSFSAARWTVKQQGERQLHEVAIIAEYLDRDTNRVATTVLHQAAIAMSFCRGLKCCSDRYHNRRFRDAAEELGLVAKRIPNYGFAHTTLPMKTARLYQPELARLEQALICHRNSETSGNGRQSSGSRLRKAVCRCGFIIRASGTTLNATNIICGTCIERFERV